MAPTARVGGLTTPAATGRRAGPRANVSVRIDSDIEQQEDDDSQQDEDSQLEDDDRSDDDRSQVDQSDNEQESVHNSPSASRPRDVRNDGNTPNNDQDFDEDDIPPKVNTAPPPPPTKKKAKNTARRSGQRVSVADNLNRINSQDRISRSPSQSPEPDDRQHGSQSQSQRLGQSSNAARFQQQHRGNTAGQARKKLTGPKLGAGGGGGGKGKSMGRGRLLRSNQLNTDAIHKISKGDLRRLARRGGVKRIGLAIYEDARMAMRDFLTDVIKNAVAVVELRRRQTLTVKDVIYALKTRGRSLYGYE